MTGRTFQMIFSLQKTEGGKVLKNSKNGTFAVISEIDFAQNMSIPYSNQIEIICSDILFKTFPCEVFLVELELEDKLLVELFCE